MLHAANQRSPFLNSFRLLLSGAMLLCGTPSFAQASVNPPRWEAHYTALYSEGPTVGPGTGLLLGSNASIVTDPALMLGNKPTIRLDGVGAPGTGSIGTDPAVWPLAPNTTYIVEVQYRVVANPGNNDLLFPSLYPLGNVDQHSTINLPSLLRNAAATGTFSSGALTNSATSYQFSINAGPQVSIVIGNIVIYRKDAVQTTTPPAWTGLSTLPFPRLGAWYSDNPDFNAGGGRDGVPPYTFTVDQIEKSLAFADLIVGFSGEAQALGVDSIRRLRQLNPTAAIVGEHPGGALQYVSPVPPPNSGFVDLLYQFQQGIADQWYLRDSHGNYVLAGFGPRLPNLTSSCPIVNGRSYGTYAADWITGQMFPSGLWDGYWSDDLFAVINPHIPIRGDPPVLDADFNANGIPDETRAAVSDWMRSGVIGLLQSVRDRVGDTELIMGNTGPEPQVALAPWVNGFVQECTNSAWEPPGASAYDEGAWRRVFDAYRTMQATARRPALSLFTGCGGIYSNFTGTYISPTAADIRRQRLVTATALLDDGFCYYSLGDFFRAPYWFDEMTVDSNGAAVQDRRYKGYLGSALASASELAPGGPTIFQQDFEAPPVSSSLSTSGDVHVTKDASEVISGQGSLVLSNPDHTKDGTVTVSTKPGAIQLAPGSTYLFRLDWRILETLDDSFRVIVCGDSSCIKNFALDGIVKGDSGTINLPLTVTSAASNWTLTFGIYGGGGKVAVDNLRVVQGGAGPWRRDFENGFVLVNPLNQPHTFSAAELAGALGRTGIHRIKGTQAPDVNDGQPVTGNLTLNAFDAVILLADHIVSGRHKPVSGPPGGQPVTRRP
jgi:hypothetical protein